MKSKLNSLFTIFYFWKTFFFNERERNTLIQIVLDKTNKAENRKSNKFCQWTIENHDSCCYLPKFIQNSKNKNRKQINKTTTLSNNFSFALIVFGAMEILFEFWLVKYWIGQLLYKYGGCIKFILYWFWFFPFNTNCVNWHTGSYDQ